MTSEIALPNEFKQVVREKILSVFMGLISVEEIDNLVTKEIKAFFENEVMLTIDETKISIDNPQYDSKQSSYGYSNQKTLDLPACVFGTKMTPFRQLTWSTLHQYLQPKIKAIIDDVNTEAGKELQNIVEEQFKPKVGDTFKAIFTETTKSMASTMFYKQMEFSLITSHTNMINSLRIVGIPTDSLMNSSGMIITKPPQQII